VIQGISYSNGVSSLNSLDPILNKLPPPSWSTVASLFVMAVIILGCWITRPELPAQVEMEQLDSTSETLQGRVLEVVEVERDSNDPMSGQEAPFSIKVEITKGDRKGNVIQVAHGAGLIMTESRQVGEGNRVMVEHSITTMGERYYITDFYRLPSLFLLGLIFVIATIIVGRWLGLRSLFSMGFSVMIIILFLLPRLVAGQNPVLICVIGALLGTGPSLYLTYGWKQKTHSALLSIMLSLVVTSLVAAVSVDWSRLTGFSTDESTYLLAILGTSIDMRALVLGGIIIGALGVLDDVCVSQASAIFELKVANPSLGWKKLFQHGMIIGRDHMASMVNTLMMAYVGAAMPLFLLLITANVPLHQTINRELLAEEIIRTLAGSLGLILAVPITSSIASLVAYSRKPESPSQISSFPSPTDV
jgi:uncharacterized membrane protein